MKALTTAVILCASLTTGYAASFTDIVVYGDSLSDNGNVFAASSSIGQPTPPSPPYYQGRFSNGPVGVEDMAAFYGVPLLDFAYGGATTGLGDEGDGGSVTQMKFLPGITSQYLGSQNKIAPIASNSLFVVWAGPDDLVAPTPGQNNPVQIANTAAQNIINIVNGLQSLGAKTILVPGIPDLGLVPDYKSDPATAAAATLFATTFNNDLMAGLSNGAIYVDTFNYLAGIVNNPGAYGFTNVSAPCLVGSTPCVNPDQYLFWDGQHPTAAGQALLALRLETAIPEPATCLLGFGALGAFALVRRRA